MRTVYIKGLADNAFSEDSYYKVVEIEECITKRLEVHHNEINIWEMEEFENSVSSTKNIYCKNNFEMITKQEFDKNLNKTLKKINELS